MAASTCNPSDGEWEEVLGGRRGKDMAEIRQIRGIRSWLAFANYHTLGLFLHILAQANPLHAHT